MMIYRLLAAMMITGLSTEKAETTVDKWAQLDRYATANTEIVENYRPGLVVLMGNSITEGWPAAHPEFFTENNLVGRGISGQTTTQLLVRFRQDVVNLHPEIVVIAGGTNDIACNTGSYDETLTLGNIMTMVEIAQANGIKVILASVLPADSFFWNKSIHDAPAKITALNEKIKKYADSKGIPYLDYYSSMSNLNGGMPPELSNDGVHPTPKGYSIMEKLLLPTINSLRIQ